MSTKELRELDAKIHVRVMGFPLESLLVGDGKTTGTALRLEPENAAWRVRSKADDYWHRISPDGADRVVIAPNYSQSIEAAMQVEDRISELGLRKEYLRELGPIVALRATQEGEILGYWHFTHASAEDRCRAALKAIETKDD